MFTKVSKFQNKFVTLCCCICLLLAWVLPVTVQAADVSWALAQSTSVSSAQPGDVVEVSVSIQGISTPVDAVQVSGTIEFDSNLFTLQQIVGNELSTAKVNDSSGRFTLANGLGKTINNGEHLFTAILKVNDGAPVGKTTVCVDEITITDKNGEVSSLTNFTPSAINLTKDEIEEDVDFGDDVDIEDDDDIEDDGDIEEIEVDDDMEDDEKSDIDDVDDYAPIVKRDKTPKPSKKKKTVTTSKTNVKSIRRSDGKEKTNTSSTDVDENYKTGAGLGNDWYLVVAALMGISAGGLVVVRRRIMKNKIHF